MKKILLTLPLLAILASCDDASSKIKSDGNTESKMGTELVQSQDAPEFSFEEVFHNFGDIQEGEVVTHIFSFENSGNAPLVITSAQGSCGCTVPVWPREPIAPGERGTIEVTFNSKNRGGRQDKTVTLTANTVPNTKVLKITSNVIKAETAPAAE